MAEKHKFKFDKTPHSSPLCQLNSVFWYSINDTVCRSYCHVKNTFFDKQKHDTEVKIPAKRFQCYLKFRMESFSTIFILSESKLEQIRLEPQKKKSTLNYLRIFVSICVGKHIMVVTNCASKTKLLTNSSDLGDKRSNTVNSLATNSFFLILNRTCGTPKYSKPLTRTI